MEILNLTTIQKTMIKFPFGIYEWNKSHSSLINKNVEKGANADKDINFKIKIGVVSRLINLV